jgi:DNA-binding XRE family transcriptional regulator
MNEFCKFIKVRRAEFGLSQRMLADKMGVAQGSITMWETGIGKPHQANLGKLAKALEVDYEELRDLLYPVNKRTFKVPPSPTGIISIPVGVGGGGGAQAMTQNGVALTSTEHPQVNPEPVAWVDEIWFKRPDLTSRLPYDDLFSRSEDENYVPLFERSQIGYTQEQVDLMLDVAAHLERNICAQIAYDTYEGFGKEAKGIDYVKQQIIRQIKERDKL